MDRTEKDFLLEKMMIEYGDELVRLAFSYVKDTEIAKDMVQNTFIKCYKNVDTFRYDAHIKTWLYRIAINECKDYLKSWHFKMVQVKSFIHETAKSIYPSTEKTVIDKYNNEELKDTIFSLPKVYREVVYLYYYESLKTDEIAEVLDIPMNTVKTRLRRAKQRLESMIKEAELNGR
ncbi:sigma-70 family RNA polymerase sigma factor [Lysinibacillus sphaericus]|uniref:ECF subfamily RNA polymerase sigma-24 subunit n=2 Tax=Lysinibacillus TaxID=400634 RepID=A0A2S0JZF7_LYSSH|nr:MULTISPECIES: sigma-70 family RNA polymerase sigma factor [Lysinibacillus]AVK96374.1 RNA polymerase factor sigma C [Lysinibacillus sphaericus]MED4545423.1 sigma-70 family RNA polymerase sigma factor [Lysinibacillus sphaericus]TKI19617.1 sigma-70 family RNA polymerase sigma factor [Lysinibacillus sphaericus]TKI50241.1 sigma-70 family RNA polymerase sigma factor [Lysinibacillus tabacifolii]SUV17838.1 ECF subfamily RNA polymerase sigma-24 subunit [Lysinibacillus sphaericus]